VTIRIILLLLLGVAEDGVCFAYLLKLLLGCGVLVPVGVEVECEFPECLLYLLRGGVLVYAENLVVVALR